jgi:hypothetical protein
VAKGLIEGYEADIYRAIWERPKTFGAPRAWAAGWLIAVLYAALLALMAGHPRGILYVGLAWFGGQGILVALTQWDPDWDRLFVRWLTRRGTHYYRAG